MSESPRKPRPYEIVRARIQQSKIALQEGRIDEAIEAAQTAVQDSSDVYWNAKSLHALAAAGHAAQHAQLPTWQAQLRAAEHELSVQAHGATAISRDGAPATRIGWRVRPLADGQAADGVCSPPVPIAADPTGRAFSGPDRAASTSQPTRLTSPTETGLLTEPRSRRGSSESPAAHWQAGKAPTTAAVSELSFQQVAWEDAVEFAHTRQARVDGLVRVLHARARAEAAYAAALVGIAAHSDPVSVVHADVSALAYPDNQTVPTPLALFPPGPQPADAGSARALGLLHPGAWHGDAGRASDCEDSVLRGCAALDLAAQADGQRHANVATNLGALAERLDKAGKSGKALCAELHGRVAAAIKAVQMAEANMAKQQAALAASQAKLDEAEVGLQQAGQQLAQAAESARQVGVQAPQDDGPEVIRAQSLLAEAAEHEERCRSKLPLARAALAQAADQVQAAGTTLVEARAARQEEMFHAAAALECSLHEQGTEIEAALRGSWVARAHLLDDSAHMQRALQTVLADVSTAGDTLAFLHRARVRHMVRRQRGELATLTGHSINRTSAAPDSANSAKRTWAAGKRFLAKLGGNSKPVPADPAAAGDSMLPGAADWADGYQAVCAAERSESGREATSTASMGQRKAWAEPVAAWVAQLFAGQGQEVLAPDCTDLVVHTEDGTEALNVALLCASQAGRELVIRVLSRDRGSQQCMRGDVASAGMVPCTQPVQLASSYTCAAPGSAWVPDVPGPEHTGLRLAHVLWWLLDACCAVSDVSVARAVLVLSETYHVGEHTRSYLQAVLVGHAMWQRDDVYEEALYRTVRDEVQRLHVAGGDVSGSSPSAAASVVATGSVPGSASWCEAYSNTLFSQLSSYALNMLLQGRDVPSVQRWVTRVGAAHGVRGASLAAVLQMVASHSASAASSP